MGFDLDYSVPNTERWYIVQTRKKTYFLELYSCYKCINIDYDSEAYAKGEYSATQTNYAARINAKNELHCREYQKKTADAKTENFSWKRELNNLFYYHSIQRVNKAKSQVCLKGRVV